METPGTFLTNPWTSMPFVALLVVVIVLVIALTAVVFCLVSRRLRTRIKDRYNSVDADTKNVELSSDTEELALHVMNDLSGSDSADDIQTVDPARVHNPTMHGQELSASHAKDVMTPVILPRK